MEGVPRIQYLARFLPDHMPVLGLLDWRFRGGRILDWRFAVDNLSDAVGKDMLAHSVTEYLQGLTCGVCRETLWELRVEESEPAGLQKSDLTDPVIHGEEFRRGRSIAGGHDLGVFEDVGCLGDGFEDPVLQCGLDSSL
ncbi:hypothetical protein NDU88_007048 [Pleurodeles waltl]|uniref:Uncharacterized protein n=1 Tax=Pleurodeles waltl TaxID=8319 RepID=A0AAV7TYL9_PLEWA|nr:hypothetical protein NDU88_007048 [Pleurodeles waltl]